MDGGGWPDRWAKSVRGDLFRLRPKNFRKLGLDHTRKDENQKFSDSKQVVLRSLAEIMKGAPDVSFRMTIFQRTESDFARISKSRTAARPA